MSREMDTDPLRPWRWVVIAGAVGVVAATVTVLAIANRDERQPGAPPCSAVPTVPNDTRTGPIALDGGGLRVVESGYTQINGERSVSLGAVVENTSAQVAYQTQIRFTVSDEHGQSAAHPQSGELLVQRIAVVLPGQRIGVGAWTGVKLTNSQPVTVSGFRLDIESSDWFAAPAGTVPIASVHVATEPDPVVSNSATVRYEMTSAYCEPVPFHHTAIVFRNGSGAIVGGSYEADDTHAGRQCDPGMMVRTAWAFKSAPDRLDPGRTTAYPSCEFVRATA